MTAVDTAVDYIPDLPETPHRGAYVPRCKEIGHIFGVVGCAAEVDRYRVTGPAPAVTHSVGSSWASREIDCEYVDRIPHGEYARSSAG
jgi:hypothetical protein